MFITRGTRHDRDDLREFYEKEQWSPEGVDVTSGTAFLARDGRIVGALRLLEIDPQTIVVDDVLVASDRRGAGIGAQIMQAAMNSRGGTLYLCCHEERLRFYGDLGFGEVDPESLPPAVLEYFKKQGDYPSRPDHVHFFLKAR
ncbi:MAG: Acetyltransferase domain [Actinomycetota bacterium]|jgi:N-acetylglutamate synthase-like GNAT family acetyltransferase|nr:Acetyltransferase domain [Actinomycetota bacterium]